MSAMLRYVYQSNIRQFSILLAVFTLLQVGLFLDVKFFHIFSMPIEISFSFFVLLIIICNLLLFIQAISTFRRLIGQTIVRTAPVATVKIILAPLAAWVVATVVLWLVTIAAGSLYMYTDAKVMVLDIFGYTYLLGWDTLKMTLIIFLGGCVSLTNVFLAIVLAKSLPLGRRGNIIAAFAFLVVSSTLIIGLSDFLHTIGPSFTVVGEVHMQGGNQTSMDIEAEQLTLLGSLFDLATFVGLLFGTAYFLENHVEG